MGRPITTEELIKATFWNQANRIWTSIPCIVVAVKDDFKEQLVDVQPSVNILRPDGAVSEQAVIYNVPVIMPATSTSAITMPINVGDTVMCMFSQKAIEVWQESDGKPSTPNNYAKFHKKDAVAIVGLFPRKNAVNNPNKRTHAHSTKDLVIAHNIGKANEVEIRFKPNGDMIVNTPAKVEVNCNTASITADTSITVDSPTTNWTGDINLTGSLTASVEVTASGKALSTHLHNTTAVQSGGSTKISTPPL
jgi:Phage protein Gp138 N-terminal domain